MKIETMPASQLSTAECKKLRSLTLRKGKKYPNGGELRSLLSDWRYDDRARVVRVSDDDGKVLAWGMSTPYDSRNNYDTQLYVRKSERRKGLGKLVYQRLVNSAGGRASCIVHPHSQESVDFFNKVHYVPQGLPPHSLPPTKSNEGRK